MRGKMILSDPSLDWLYGVVKDRYQEIKYKAVTGKQLNPNELYEQKILEEIIEEVRAATHDPKRKML